MQRYEKLRENLYGAHLMYGKIDLKPTHGFSCHFIVEHTDEEDFIEEQFMQLLLAGCRNFDFYGEKKSIWRKGYKTVYRKLYPNPTEETFACFSAWGSIEGFAGELRDRLSVRYFVPQDFYILYDDKELYHKVLELLDDKPIDVPDKYGFYDTDKNAFLCSDGHCWCNGIDLATCEKEKTGDKIELKYDLEPTFHLRCEADIYKLILSEEEYKYSAVTKDTTLYVAIGDVGKYGSLISSSNRSFSEAFDQVNQQLGQE